MQQQGLRISFSDFFSQRLPIMIIAIALRALADCISSRYAPMVHPPFGVSNS